MAARNAVKRTAPGRLMTALQAERTDRHTQRLPERHARRDPDDVAIAERQDRYDAAKIPRTARC